MFRYSLFILGIIAYNALLFERVSAQDDTAAEAPKTESTSADEQAVAKSDQFEDAAEPIDLQAERTEGEQDRVKAAAFFTHGRMLLQRGDKLRALRRIQRAWRYDPNLVPIWEHIFPLARGTRPSSELARYAILAAEQSPREPDLMLELAEIASRNKEHARALELVESASELLDKDDSKKRFLSRWEIARLSFLIEDYSKAADHAHQVQTAIESPDDFGLGAKDTALLTKDESKTYQFLAEVYLQADRFDEAEAVSAKAFGDDEAKRTVHSARVMAKQEKEQEALQRLEDFIVKKRSGSGTEVYRLYRELVKKTAEEGADRDVLATEKLVAIQKEDPANTDLANVTAFSLLKAGNAEDAAKILSESFEIEPTDTGYLGLIEAYAKLKQPEPLLKILAQATEKFGSLQPLDSQTKPIAEDKELVKQLAELATAKDDDEPVNEHESLAMVWIAVQSKDVGLADEMFAQVLTVTEEETSDLLWQFGLWLYLEDQQTHAQTTFRKLVKEKLSNKEKQRAYTYLARSLEIDGKTNEALAMAKRVAVIAPNSAASRSQLGWITYHAKRYDEAKEHYVRLIDKFEADSSEVAREVLREARMILSNICVYQKDLPAAEEWLEQVLDEYPEDIGAYNDLGYLWADQNKNLRRSLRMLQRAVAAEPDNYAYRDSLGWAFYRLGKLDDAKRELEKACELEEPDGVILDHLADVYHKMGDEGKAIETWNRALETLDGETDADLHDAISKKLDQHESKEASR